MNLKLWLEDQDSFPGSTVKELVYHGTDKKFDQFSYQKSQRQILFSSFEVEAKGFFFSESPHDALEYGKNIIACYINLRNPLLDPRRDKHLGIDRLPHKKEMDLLKILGPMIEREKSNTSIKNGEPYIDIGIRRVWLKSMKYSDYAYRWIYEAVGPDGLDWDVLDTPQVVDRIKALGYDGTFVQEPESSLGRSIFVLSPEQIKIVKRINGPQPGWGDKDDYYTRKVDGIAKLFKPTTT